MRVRVIYFTTLRELAGRSEEEIEMRNEASLADLIDEIASKYGKEARDYLYHKGEKIDPSIRFLVNGAEARISSGLSHKLKDGDVVAMIPPIGGG